MWLERYFKSRIQRSTQVSVEIACFFLLARRLTRSAIYGSQIFDSHKWPTALVRKVNGKPRNFEANLCGSLFSTFKTSFQSYAFYNKWLQTLFIDQLVWSKATCSFKHGSYFLRKRSDIAWLFSHISTLANLWRQNIAFAGSMNLALTTFFSFCRRQTYNFMIGKRQKKKEIARPTNLWSVSQFPVKEFD